MHIGEVCTREVVFCVAGTSIAEAAKLMREYHVGSLVVAEDRDGRQIPTGVITDRDLVVEVLALDVPPGAVTVGDIKIAELATVDESEDVIETIELMRHKGVRRMPVVDQQGALAGIVTLDDLLEIVAEEMEAMVKLLSRERLHEAKSRPARMPQAPAARH